MHAAGEQSAGGLQLVLRATRVLAFFVWACRGLRRSHGWKSDLCRQNTLQGYTNPDSFANLSAQAAAQAKSFVAASDPKTLASKLERAMHLFEYPSVR